MDTLSNLNNQVDFENALKQYNIDLTLNKVSKAARNGRLGEDNNVLRNVRLYTQALQRVLEDALDALESGAAMPRRMNVKLLVALGPETVSSIVVSTVLVASSYTRVTRDSMSRLIGKMFKATLSDMWLAKHNSKEVKQALKGVHRLMKNTSHTGERKVKMAQDLLSKIYKNFKLNPPDSENYQGLATDVLIQLSKIKLNMGGELKPLIIFKDSKSKQGVRVILEPWFTEAYMDAIRDGRFVTPLYAPLIEQPLAHAVDVLGGYHTDFFKYKLIQSRHVKNPKQSEDFEAINALQGTKFRIDLRILEAQHALYNANICAGNFERLVYGKFSVPRPAETIGPDGVGIKQADMDEKTLKTYTTWRKSAGAYYNNKERITSIVGMQARNLSAAELFKHREGFYFAYYYDSRGRIYPKTSSLSPQGACESKSLLQFSEGSPIRNNRAALENWLANGASLFGHDKWGFKERLNWSLENGEMILSCAENYMDDLRWADEPKEAFMALQFCFDYKEWIDKGDDFIIHSVVPLDGTCNGLQHLAAMTKDEVSGKLVNLREVPERQDIYQVVADDLIRALKQVNEDWSKEVIKLGIITRKFTKRSVMTKPYNVGLSTVMLEHVGGFLKDPKNNVQYLIEKYPSIVADLGKLLWNTMNTGALNRPNEAMEWLGYVEGLMITEDYQYTEWVTPAGFPVTQRYFKSQAKTKESKGLFGDRVCVRNNYITTIPDKRKRKNALAPNLIHSMDAAHLQLTIKECKARGITSFWFIHDSFAVPVHQIEILKEVLREVFVKMYDGIDHFRRFSDALPSSVQAKIEWYPAMGSLDFEEVLNSEHFFA